MAWDDHARLLTMKAIGTVESGLKYDCIYYPDAITIGVCQWYGPLAAGLLNLMKNLPQYQLIEKSLRDDVASHPAVWTNKYWENRMLTRAEGNSMKPVLTCAAGVKIQNADFLKTIEDFKAPALKLGINPETNTQAFQYFCGMYHQSPKYCRQVTRAAGSNASMERLHTISLNHPWYSDFKNRQNTMKRIILSNDISGLPGGFDDVVQSEDSEIGDIDFSLGGIGSGINWEDGQGGTGTSDGGQLVSEKISAVELVGDQLHIKVGDKTVIGLPTNTNKLWLVGHQSQTVNDGPPPASAPPSDLDPSPTPTEPVSPGDATIGAKVAQWMLSRIKKFNYSQGDGRDNPDKTGYGDCSSTIRRAYRDVARIETGTYTVDMQNYGRVVWSNLPNKTNTGARRGDVPPPGTFQLGDLVFVGNSSSTYRRVVHVEMYVGNNQLCGHGGPKWHNVGPTIKENAAGYVGRKGWIIIRRLL